MTEEKDEKQRPNVHGWTPQDPPGHIHHWGYFSESRTYKCRCGAERSDYPYGPATYKD